MCSKFEGEKLIFWVCFSATIRSKVARRTRSCLKKVEQKVEDFFHLSGILNFSATQMRRKSRAAHLQLLKRQRSRCIVLKSLETIFLLWKTTCKWKTQGSLTTENEKSFLMLHLWKIIAFVLESNDQQLFCYTKKSKFFPLKWKWWIQYFFKWKFSNRTSAKVFTPRKKYVLRGTC